VDVGTDDRDSAQLAMRLAVAVTRLRSRLREEAGMTSSGFTVSQLAILQRFLDEGPMTAAELASAEHVSPQSISQSIAILREAALVQGDRAASDGRKVVISLTSAGRDMFESLLASRKAWLAEAIEVMIGDQRRADLDATIEKLEMLAGADLRVAAQMQKVPAS
jgi:DNA-binding MarR family transcriptional regulator